MDEAVFDVPDFEAKFSQKQKRLVDVEGLDAVSEKIAGPNTMSKVCNLTLNVGIRLVHAAKKCAIWCSWRWTALSNFSRRLQLKIKMYRQPQL